MSYDRGKTFIEETYEGNPLAFFIHDIYEYTQNKYIDSCFNHHESRFWWYLFKLAAIINDPIEMRFLKYVSSEKER